MTKIYVITQTHYSNDCDENHTESIVAFTDKEQANDFIEAGKNNTYAKFYDMTCIALID